MANRKSISLSNELHLLLRAMDGSQELANRWVDGSLDNPKIPGAIPPNLLVMVERMRLLDRVVRDEVDPRLLWCPENDAPHILADPNPGEKDVIFTARSDWKCVRRLSTDTEMAKHRLHRTKERE